ncbi:hypothetical protein BGX34_004297 [Mortierella sp. NVP85]|nr:hypothetical protein BGX34_004297 [Mortierella sp. NVP85]
MLMAFPMTSSFADSNVLRQLIDQIEGERSLALSEDSRSGSTLSMASEQLPEQPQQQSFPTSATSAIFGTTTFERPTQQQTQQQPLFRATSLVINGSYFVGPRAPQYIPSPLASPVSPGVEDPLLNAVYRGADGQDEESILKPSSSQGSISALAADLLQEHHQRVAESAATKAEAAGTRHQYQEAKQDTTDSDQVQQRSYDDDIKVDVTELYENFGQKKPVKIELEAVEAMRSIMNTVDSSAPLSSSLPSKLPELSFSNNDLTSLLAPAMEPPTTFHNRTDIHDQGQLTESNPLAIANRETGKNSGMEAGHPMDNQATFNEQILTDRKRFSLVTSGAGPVVASESQLEKSILDLELDALSPPVEVKEIGAASAPISVNTRGGAVDGQQETLHDNNQHLNNPASASLTPTTPLTTREARILAGREALLKMSPDKQWVQRGLSTSSASSSIASAGKPSGDPSEISADSHGTTRRISFKSQHSLQSHQTQSDGGTYGAVPERGQFKDIPAEKLVFPDQSTRPVPLKAYRIRKMTLKEKNDAYTQACEEFRRARTGLEVWTLRCMMQDRPPIMKDPPAIVKAVTARHGPGSQTQFDSHSRSYGTSGRMTPTTPLFSPVTISGASGIGARLKNASKRLSMDVSGTISGAISGTTSGSYAQMTPDSVGYDSLFYKQKSAKSAVELGSWSSARGRGLSNSSHVSLGTLPPPLPQMSESVRNSISGTMASPSSQQQQQTRSGSTYLPHNKRHSISSTSSPLSNSIRSRAMSDVNAENRLSMVGRDFNSTQDSASKQQQSDSESSSLSSSYTGPSNSTTTSAFMERPIQRSMSSRYNTRRPTSMMAIPNQQQPNGLSRGFSSGSSGSGNHSGSNISIGSQSSSSIASLSSHSVTESVEFKDSPTTSSLTPGSGPQQGEEAGATTPAPIATETDASITQRPGIAFNADGTPIPYADETKSKDEVYSPLTSPIMIPLGGFTVSKPTHNTNSGYRTNAGWASPQSANGGFTRPLTYAGPSIATLNSNSALITSPTTFAREQQQHHGFSSLGPERRASGTTSEATKEKPEKSHRYSTASFSSIGSFAKSQRRSSKKDRKNELLEQQQQQQQQPSDQRYSVSSAPVNANVNEYWTEQSLDKLSDVLPHVDRDRLSLYLQRAYGDEMVAIGLAMSDLRSGQL